MVLTKLKLSISEISKINYVDHLMGKDNDESTGFLQAEMKLSDSVAIENDSVTVFIEGKMNAYQGKDDGINENKSQVFSLEMNFSLRYRLEEQLDEGETSDLLKSNKDFFNKDATIILNSNVNRILSETRYKSIHLLYQ